MDTHTLLNVSAGVILGASIMNLVHGYWTIRLRRRVIDNMERTRFLSLMHFCRWLRKFESFPLGSKTMKTALGAYELGYSRAVADTVTSC